MLEKDMSLEEIVRTVTGDENALFLINDLEIAFECDCSKDRFAEGLASIPKDEIEKIITEDGEANTKCHFCGKEYNFSKENLEEIRDRM